MSLLLGGCQGPVAPAGRTPGCKTGIKICLKSCILYPFHHLGVVLRLTLNLMPIQR